MKKYPIGFNTEINKEPEINVSYEGCHHLKKEQTKLENFCPENGLSYFVNNGNLHIITHHSKWKIIVSNNKNRLELHHQSSYQKEYEDSVSGYHKQSHSSNLILGYMKYINEHEYYRMRNPLHIVTKKEPPKKGTKRYRGQQKAMARKERQQQIRNVLNLIDSLSVDTCITQA